MPIIGRCITLWAHGPRDLTPFGCFPHVTGPSATKACPWIYPLGSAAIAALITKCRSNLARCRVPESVGVLCAPEPALRILTDGSGSEICNLLVNRCLERPHAKRSELAWGAEPKEVVRDYLRLWCVRHSRVGDWPRLEQLAAARGCSTHNVPSLSNVAIRSAGGAKSGPGPVVDVTKSMTACLAGPSLQLASTAFTH